MLATATLLTWITLAQPGPAPAARPDEPKPAANAAAAAFEPDPAWKSLGKDIWFDGKARRVVLRTRVCLNDGILEHFLCLKGTKEHESILATEAPARAIHAALLLAGAEPGHPVRFEPRFEPPAGPTIGLEVEWEVDGKKQKVDARRWVKDTKTDKELAHDWVFAGSELFNDRRTGKAVYAADDGDFITVANFGSSILDLPYRSSASDADRAYAASPDRVPPRGTAVTLYLAPRKPAEADQRPK